MKKKEQTRSPYSPTASAEKEAPWWAQEYNFFGQFYMEGDNSSEGYLIEKRQNLQSRTISEVDGIIRLLQIQSGKILDCPCGYGRHSIELARRGYPVTGSDLNHIHLNRAVQDTLNNGLNIRFRKENMLELDYDNEFDAAINMFYSFGFFESDEENFEVLRNFHRALTPGGKFLMHTDVNVPRIAQGLYKEDEVRTLLSGNTLRIIDKYDPVTKRINGSWQITDQRGLGTLKKYSVRVYTKEEFVDLCLLAGFSHCKVYSDWKGTPYSDMSEDMIVVAYK